MAQLLLLRGARQLLTLRGPSGVRRSSALRNLGIIEDGAVLIRDGLVAEVGTSRRVENLKEARNAIEIPVNGSLVMPGFIDPNLNVSLEGGSPELPRRRKSMSRFYEETLSLMRACLQHGTLTAEIKASSGISNVRSDVSVLRQLSKIGNNPVRMMRTWRISSLPDANGDPSKELRPILAVLIRRKLIQFLELTFDCARVLATQAFEPTLSEAAKLDIKLAWRGENLAALADFDSRLHIRTICCPSDMSPSDCSILANTSLITIFSPGKEVLDTPPSGNSARAFIDAGGALALSTGYDPWRAPNFSMQMVVALAVMRLGLTPEEAISAATVNAAHAAGCAHLTGTIEVGKKADIVVLEIPDYRELPRQFGMNHVSIAIRDGIPVINRTRSKVGAR